MRGTRFTLLHRVSHEEVRGARFYEGFLDRWPEYMRLAYQATRAALEDLSRQTGRVRSSWRA